MCAFASVIALGVFACRSFAVPRLVQDRTVVMGSELNVAMWTGDQAGARAAIAAVFAEFNRLDALMSVWKTGSDVLRLNEAAGVQPVTVAAETIAVLHEARQVSEWSGGKFDVTFGVLSDLWRFDHDQDNRVPNMSEVRRRLPLIDYRALRIDDPPGTAFLTRSGMRVHLGGIGKGYAIDRGIAILRGRGFSDFMIQAGGDMYAGGRKDGQPWRLGIQDPRGPRGRIFAAIDLSDSTFSTSGDYERSFMKDGVRYHHIIDPSTGEPARGCRSSTVLADRAIVADGLSKMPFWLGPKDALALYERLHVEAVIVTTSNEVLFTPGLKGRLELLSAPTDGV